MNCCYKCKKPILAKCRNGLFLQAICGGKLPLFDWILPDYIDCVFFFFHATTAITIPEPISSMIGAHGALLSEPVCTASPEDWLVF